MPLAAVPWTWTRCSQKWPDDIVWHPDARGEHEELRLWLGTGTGIGRGSVKGGKRVGGWRQMWLRYIFVNFNLLSIIFIFKGCGVVYVEQSQREV